MSRVNNFIRKWGEEEGKKRYKECVEKIKSSNLGRNTLKWYIDRFGEEEGDKRQKNNMV